MFFLEMLGQKYFVFSAGFKSICLGNTWQSSSFIPVVLTEFSRGKGKLLSSHPGPYTGDTWQSLGTVFGCHISGCVCAGGRGVSILIKWIKARNSTILQCTGCLPTMKNFLFHIVSSAEVENPCSNYMVTWQQQRSRVEKWRKTDSWWWCLNSGSIHNLRDFPSLIPSKILNW